jgi:hypothetical protein
LSRKQDSSGIKIVAEQVDSAPWVDIFGKNHPEKHMKLWDSFMNCMTCHLLTVFPNNAADTEWYYIGNGLKKSNRVQFGSSYNG